MKERLCLILDDCETLGGIQLMTLDTAKVLSRAGYHVTMVCRRLGKWLAERLAGELAGVRVVRRKSYGITTVDMLVDYVQGVPRDCGLSINMHGDVQPVVSDVVYFHQFNVDYRYLSGGPRARALLSLQQYLRRKFVERLKEAGAVVLVNSNFTRAEASYFWGLRDVRVVYPPVHVERYSNWGPADTRKDRVVTVRRLDDYVLGLVKRLAAHLSRYEFVVAGSVKDVRGLWELHGLPPNVRVLPNVSEEVKSELLRSSKVYLNANPFVEGFGIAVVEGMAAGDVPVTRAVGGPLDYAPREFMFSKVEEIPEKVAKAMESWSPGLAEEMREVARKFSMERYEAELLDVISKLS